MQRLSSVLRPTTGRLLRLASSSARPLHEEIGTSDGYGNEYGAGPSRIPYDPRPPTPTSLKRMIINASHGSFDGPVNLAKHLNVDYSDLQSGQLEEIVEGLIERKHEYLAVDILSKLVAAGQHVDDNIIERLSRSIATSVPLKWNPNPRLTRRVDALIEFVRLLRSSRIRRPLELLTAAIQLALHERRPDKAAALFVGMVEDWVTEGRAAEGADPEGFHPGGGPPVAHHKSSQRHAAWWIGVRTWKLPGEVLSPHERQDLWHPYKLSLGEKLRGFPFANATSPPSLVPAPTTRLLNPILQAIRINPEVTPKADFEASMRALAILANAILNRTLPCLSVGPLIDKLQKSPYIPPVYPLDMPDVPADKKWAYEATVHVHLALQSLMFSPPISSSSFAEAHAHEAVITGSAPMGSLAQFYRMQPLKLRDCVSLVRYGFEILRLPAALRRLVKWTRSAYDYGGSSPAFWNAIFRGASEVKDNRLAMVAETSLFSETGLALPIVNKETRKPSLSEDCRLLVPRPTVLPSPDQKSVLILIRHLGKTSQFERLEKIIYQLLPYLSGTANDKQELIHLSPELYTAMIDALRLAGRSGLAQRVYRLALRAETEQGSAAQLPIACFTSMLTIWANEVDNSYPRPRRQIQEYAKGWRLPRGTSAGIARHDAAILIATEVYQTARSRWMSASSRKVQPDADFFTAALTAHSWIFRFRNPERPVSVPARRLLEEMLRDMMAFGVTIPPMVLKHAQREEIEKMTRKDWNCAAVNGSKEVDVHDLDLTTSESKTRDVAEQLLMADEDGLWRRKGIVDDERQPEHREEAEILR